MEKLEKKLEKMGIDGKEAVIYIELLKLKEATVAQLSKNASIKRTSVYYCLEALMKKGLIGLTDKNNKKIYFVEDPKSSLNGLVEQQKSVIDEMLPQIRDIYGKGSSLPAIKIYYNEVGIKNIFEDVLACKEKVARYYISDFSVDEMLGESFLKYFVKRRILAKIKSLSLRNVTYEPEREKEVSQEKQLRETRFLPKNLVLAPYMCIYDNKSVVISPKEKIGFIVESQEYADAQKAIFDTIWKISGVTGLKSGEVSGDDGQTAQKATEEDIYY